MVNPQTGERFSDQEILDHLDLIMGISLHIGSVGRIRRAGGVYDNPPPKIPPTPLSNDERAFFAGMRVGGLTVKRVPYNISKTFHIVASTGYSEDLTRKWVTTEILRPWGEVKPVFERNKIYMSDDLFNYLLTPTRKLAQRYIGSDSNPKSKRFPLFMAGYITTGISPKGYGSMVDCELLHGICRSFDNYYFDPDKKKQLTFGKFWVKHNNKTGKDYGAVFVRDVRVRPTILRDERVKRLPLYNFLSLPKAIIEGRAQILEKAFQEWDGKEETNPFLRVTPGENGLPLYGDVFGGIAWANEDSGRIKIEN